MINLKELKQLSEKLSILYVEDDDVLRTQTETIFRNLFKSVDIARDGEEGLSIYKNYLESNNKNYDIVITDIQMPKMDGIDLSKALLQINKNQKIIIISAYDEKEYIEEVVKLGIDGFMQKPLSTDQILEILQEACTSLNK